MGWSDFLGGIGGIASGIGGLIGGPWGQVIGGVGALANLGGSIGATINSSGQSAHATDITGHAADDALALAEQRAKEEQAAYNKIMGLIPEAKTAYDAAITKLGPMPDAPVFDPNNVEERARVLLPEYMNQADRSVEGAFSHDMGRLMTSGLDNSTFGVQARAAEGAQSEVVHRTAYNNAYNDALKYATDIYNTSSASHTGMLNDRTAALKEIMEPYTTQIGDYMNLYGHTSSGDPGLGTAGTLAGSLLTGAATGSNALATGAATSGLKNTISDAWAGLQSIFGGGDGSYSTTPDPFVYSNPYGGTTASGRDY